MPRHAAVDSTPKNTPEWFASALVQTGQSAHVNANGINLHYLGWNLENTALPVLLLLHGFRSHAHWWDWTAPYLATDYRVIALDLSGMGDSGHRSAYGPDTFSDDVTALLDCLELTSVIGIGHSYGGSTLLRACRKRPELFSRLILIDTTLPFADEAATPPPPPQPTANVCYPDLDTAISRFTLRPRQPSGLPFVLQHVARHSARRDADGWRWKFDPAVYPFDRYRFDADELLAAIDVPLDYIRAACSSVTSPARARILAAALRLRSDRRMIEIPDANHHLMIDQPIALIAALRALLASRG